MSFTDKLFSLEGRLRRRDWWLLSIGINVAVLVLQSVVLGVLSSGGTPAAQRMLTPTMSLAFVVQMLFAVLIFYPAAAVSVKRAQDRDRPQWIVWVYYILTFLYIGYVGYVTTQAGAAMATGVDPASTFDPGALVAIGLSTLVILVYAIYLFVELGCLDGTPGPNRYGPSPKHPDLSAETFA